MINCKRCGRAGIVPGRMSCSICGAINTDAPAVGEVGGTVRDADFIDMASVDPPAIERYDVGEPWNSAWGGGIVPTSSTLLIGAPGGGKSTLLLALALRLAERVGKPAYYICSEMAASELRYTLNRIAPSLKEGQLRVLKSGANGGAIDRAVLVKTPPSVLIVDSITDMVGLKDHHGHVALCKHYRAHAKEFKAPAMLISQISKGGPGGSDAYGLAALQHDVDTYMGLEGVMDGPRMNRLMREYEIDDGLDIRVIVALKNRYGPANIDYPFAVTAKGLVGLERREGVKDGVELRVGHPVTDAALYRMQLVERLEEAKDEVRELKVEIAELDERLDKAALKEERKHRTAALGRLAAKQARGELGVNKTAAARKAAKSSTKTIAPSAKKTAKKTVAQKKSKR